MSHVSLKEYSVGSSDLPGHPEGSLAEMEGCCRGGIYWIWCNWHCSLHTEHEDDTAESVPYRVDPRIVKRPTDLSVLQDHSRTRERGGAGPSFPFTTFEMKVYITEWPMKPISTATHLRCDAGA